MRKGGSLCTSLIQHCRGTGFYFKLACRSRSRCRSRSMSRRKRGGGGWRTAHGCCGASIYKRRVLFCKCAPGNRSSCCSCHEDFLLFSFAILIKTFRKEVPSTDNSTVHSKRKRDMTMRWRVKETRGWGRGR